MESLTQILSFSEVIVINFFYYVVCLVCHCKSIKVLFVIFIFY